MDHQNYVQLNDKQVSILEKNGCHSENWMNVKVTDSFDPSLVWNVEFKGDVCIGNLDGDVKLYDGEKKKGHSKSTGFLGFYRERTAVRVQNASRRRQLVHSS